MLQCNTVTTQVMKIAYVNKQLPFGATDAFILPEVADHRAHGWDVWFAPLQDGPVLHDQALLNYTIAAPVLSLGIAGAALAETLRHPVRVARLFTRMLGAPTLALAVRNLAVFPKALWLGRRLKRDGFEHVRPTFEAHLAHAKMVQSALAKGSL